MESQRPRESLVRETAYWTELLTVETRTRRTRRREAKLFCQGAWRERQRETEKETERDREREGEGEGGRQREREGGRGRERGREGGEMCVEVTYGLTMAWARVFCTRVTQRWYTGSQ